MPYEIDFGVWGSIFAVPAAVADRYLKFCTEGQLKVLLLALRQGQSPVDTTGIAARLGLSEAEVNDCLQYWQPGQPRGSPPLKPPKPSAALHKRLPMEITPLI